MLNLKHLRSNTSRMFNIESNNSQKDTPSKSLKSFSVSEALVQFSSSTTTLRGQRKNFFFRGQLDGYRGGVTTAALPAPGRPSSSRPRRSCQTLLLVLLSRCCIKMRLNKVSFSGTSYLHLPNTISVPIHNQ